MNEVHLQAPKLPNPQVLFIASLSNGQTIVEGKGEWCWADGLKSPWNRLVRYAAENELNITSISLFTTSGATFTMPPMGGKPRFKGYTNQTPEETPIDFEVKRFLARDLDVSIQNNVGSVDKTEIAEFYTIAEAIYKDFTLQLWVNELNTRNSWVVMKKNK